MCYTAPVAVGGLAAGWALDRFDRRRLLIADSLVRAAAFASIPVALLAGPLAPVHLYLVATVGAGPVVVVDAVSYLALAVALASVRTLPRREPVRRQAARPGAGLGVVVRRVAGDPVLRTTTVMFALFNIGEGCLLVFLPHRAIDLGLGSGGYGYLAAAMTGGEILATAVLARWTWRRPLLSSIAIAQLAGASRRRNTVGCSHSFAPACRRRTRSARRWRR